MATLKTQILLRNDTTTNWGSASGQVLGKGEVGIEWVTEPATNVEGRCKIKIGDGVTTWTNLDYFGGSFEIAGTGNTIVAAEYVNGVLKLTKGDRVVGTQSVTTTTPSSASDNTTVPTSKAVANAIEGLANSLVTGVSSITITDDDVVNINKNTQQTGAISYALSHATKGPNTSADTTKGPSAGVTISGSGATGSIVIPRLTVDKYGHTKTLTEQTLSITMPNAYTKTETYSKTEIDTAIAAATNAAVVLKGTLGTNGTITALPTASSTTLGDAYKVITNGTYANQTAKTGDMFICYESGTSTYAWMLIPSGDDIEDTWRQIKVNGGVLLNSGTSTGALNIAQATDNPVTVSGSNGTVTISHASKNVNSLTANGRTYVTGLTFDGYGHITGYTTGTETVTNTNTSHTHKAGTGLSISGTGGTSGEVTYSLKTASTTEIGGIKILAARTTAITTNNASSTSGRYYGIEIDSNGKGFVNVPWTDTNTHYTTGLYVGATGTKSNAATTNGNTYIKLYDDNTSRANLNIKGSGATTVTSDASGNITISSTNTTYSTVTSTAAGLVHKADVANGIYMRVGSATAPSWNTILIIDGGNAAGSGYGTLS